MSAAVLAPPPPPTALPRPTSPAGPPLVIALGELWRFSVADYHKMAEVGILSDDDRVELLDGVVVRKVSKNPPHVIAARLVRERLEAVLPAGWSVWTQDPITLDAGEPEPDAMVVRGGTLDYRLRHPRPAEVPLVVEVADASIGRDQGWKRSIYARNGVPTYWIVNLVDRTLEVYTAPAAGDYTRTQTLAAADRADLVLDGATVGSVAVGDFLP